MPYDRYKEQFSTTYSPMLLLLRFWFMRSFYYRTKKVNQADIEDTNANEKLQKKFNSDVSNWRGEDRYSQLFKACGFAWIYSEDRWVLRRLMHIFVYSLAYLIIGITLFFKFGGDFSANTFLATIVSDMIWEAVILNVTFYTLLKAYEHMNAWEKGEEVDVNPTFRIATEQFVFALKD